MTLNNLMIGFNSIRFKLFALVTIVIMLLTGFLLYNNFYSTKVVRKQVAESHKSMISTYVRQIDYVLNNMQGHLFQMISSDSDIQNLKYSRSESELEYSKVRLKNKLTYDIMVSKLLDGIFYFSSESDDIIEAHSDLMKKDELENIATYIRNMKYDKEFGIHWYTVKIANEYYILNIIKTDDIYFGAWVKPENLLKSLNIINTNKVTNIIVVENSIPTTDADLIKENKIELQKDYTNYYMSGVKGKYLVVGEQSKKSNLSLVALILDRSILEKLPYLELANALIAILSLILIPVCFLILKRTVLKPINRILSAMRKIQNGDLDARIKQYPTSIEFKVLNDTFNQMMLQINQLKISVYEEKISSQKSELRHLQLQINPHFFMNSLNIIYSLALTKRYELIKDMALCLSKYFSYMSRSDRNFVPLKDEIEHVKNYIRIQELRYPNNFTHEIIVPEELLNVSVIPLIIQTFVENTIKYAITLDGSTKFSAKVELETRELGLDEFIKITITDNGKGFRDEVLSKLRQGEHIIDESGEHIGIWNVQRRLQILYEGKANITFDNLKPTGVVIEITMPLKTEF